MPVVGFRFNTIKAEKKEVVVKDVTINSSPTILSMEEKKLNIPGVNKVISLKFKFVTRYEPKIGNVELEGEVLYQTKDNKKILDEWKKKKRIDKGMALDVLNTIFRRCLSKIVNIAEMIQLPPPVRFPVVRAEERSKYIG